MKKHSSIRSSLLKTVSILTLLPLLIAVIISLLMFHRETSAHIRMENLKVAHTVATAVDLFLARPVVMLKHIIEEVDELKSPKLTDLIAVSDRLLEADPLFESISFVNSRGDLVGVTGIAAGSFTDRERKQNFSASELFKRLKVTDGVVWSEPFVSLKSGESVISLALPWRDGMISGTMNLSYLCKLVEPTKTSLNAYAFLVSPHGRLIAHPDRALVGEKEAFISIPQITAGFQGTAGTYSFSLADRSVIGSVLPFAETGWVIVAVQDKENAFASLVRMEIMLGLLILLVLATALFYSLGRVDRITNPIRDLSEFTHSIAAGEMVVRPFEPSDYGEIIELYANFQSMAAAVAERESELRERNEALALTEAELRNQVEVSLKTYEALAAEKAKLDSVLASMGEGLSILSPDYQVLLQNQAHRELVGEALGRYCYEIYDHNREACPDCPLKCAYEDGASHSKLRQVQRAGRDLYLEISASPLRNASGEITGGIEVVRDVTSRILADQEIRRLNHELEERVIERTAELEMANRELESFSYSVSHDLRAPLRHISSFCTILEGDYADKLDADGKYYLSRIAVGCHKMGLLIDDLLQLAQISRGELRRGQVNLSRMAHAIAASLAESDPARQASFRIADGLIATGDERLLDVVLNNLLSNAWKYSAQNEATIIEFGCQTIAGRPVFFVRDNGVGFDKRYADNLFVPFQRLHGGEFEGTGIGLAIVQRIIQRHDGKVWADAVVGEGATFFFTLPGACLA